VIDLYADWIEMLRELLRQGGYVASPTDKPLEVAIKYFNVQLRDISATPRRVERARSLTFEPQYAAAIGEIERKSTAGEDLSPHLSKRLVDLNYHDSLLNDWGLHHLHLSTTIGPSGFVDRTGPLLFARVTDEAFYMVAVQDHGGWTNRILLEEVLANWPELLEPFEMRGVVGLATDVSEKDHAKLRKGNVQTFTTLSNGKVYFPMGGGYNTAGSNIHTVLEHNKWVKVFRNIESDVRATLEDKRAALPSGTSFGNPPTFRLMFDSGDPVIVEMTSKHGFRYKLG
jgi:hypothetical protein